MDARSSSVCHQVGVFVVLIAQMHSLNSFSDFFNILCFNKELNVDD